MRIVSRAYQKIIKITNQFNNIRRVMPEFDEKAFRVSVDELLKFNLRCDGGSADLT